MTSMVDIDDFLPEVLRYAPNASDIVAGRHIISAARRICEATLAWNEGDKFTISTPDMEPICSIPDANIYRVKSAQLDGNDLDPESTDWLDDQYPGWDQDTALSTARYITQKEPNTISIYPRQTGTLTCRFILRPARSALALPEFLLDQHYEDIGLGAGAAMLTDPNSANPQLGIDLRQRFEARLMSLRSNEQRGQHRARPRSKGAYF